MKATKYLKSLKFFSLPVIVLLCTIVVGVKPAHAAVWLHPDPEWWGGIPYPWRGYLESCDSQPPPVQSPAFTYWLSQSQPPLTNAKVVSLTVPYGTPSVNITYHLSAAVCYSNSAVTESKDYIGSASASPAGSISGIVGTTRYLSFNPYNEVGIYATGYTDFTYSPNGGFTQSGDYAITINGATINHFTNGKYLCVGAGNQVSNLDDFGHCAQGPTTLVIHIDVQPPSTVNVQGRVFAYPDQLGGGGYANVGIETCDTDSTPDGYTDANGFFSISIQRGTGFCVRIVGNPPDVIAGPFPRPWDEGFVYRDPPGYPTFTGPTRSKCNVAFGPSVTSPLVDGYNYCYTQSSYEWQVAGHDAVADGYGGLDYSVYDRALDYGYDFVYLPTPPPTHPYLSVFGGDIHAGADLSSTVGSSGCTAATSASAVLGQRRGATSGSRDQFGVFATGSLSNFGSNNLTSGTTASFGNTPGLGNFYHTMCRPDLSKLSYDVTLASLNGGVNPAIYDLGNLPASANGKVIFWESTTGKKIKGTLAAGMRVTLISLDSVKISDDIRFKDGSTDTPSYGSISEIPALLFISNRNLVVDPDVRSITGYFVANQIFSTCSTSSTTPTSPTITGSSGGAQCTDPGNLRIYGAVAAENIYLRRLSGDAGTANETLANDMTNAGDLVLMIPELYLASPPGLTGQNDLRTFLGDLPPVF